jgi:hypothetical protein
MTLTLGSVLKRERESSKVVQCGEPIHFLLLQTRETTLRVPAQRGRKRPALTLPAKIGIEPIFSRSVFWICCVCRWGYGLPSEKRSTPEISQCRPMPCLRGALRAAGESPSLGWLADLVRTFVPCAEAKIASGTHSDHRELCCCRRCPRQKWRWMDSHNRVLRWHGSHFHYEGYSAADGTAVLHLPLAGQQYP